MRARVTEIAALIARGSVQGTGADGERRCETSVVCGAESVCTGGGATKVRRGGGGKRK